MEDEVGKSPDGKVVERRRPVEISIESSHSEFLETSNTLAASAMPSLLAKVGLRRNRKAGSGNQRSELLSSMTLDSSKFVSQVNCNRNDSMIPPLEFSAYDQCLHSFNEKGFAWKRIGLPQITSKDSKLLQERALLSFPIQSLSFTSGYTIRLPKILCINVRKIEIDPIGAESRTWDVDLEYYSKLGLLDHKINIKNISSVSRVNNKSYSLAIDLVGDERVLHEFYNESECLSILSLLEFLVSIDDQSKPRVLGRDAQGSLICINHGLVRMQDIDYQMFLFPKRLLIFESSNYLPTFIVSLSSETSVKPSNIGNTMFLIDEKGNIRSNAFNLRFPSFFLKDLVCNIREKQRANDPILWNFSTTLYELTTRWIESIRYACAGINDSPTLFSAKIINEELIGPDIDRIGSDSEDLFLISEDFHTENNLRNLESQDDFSIVTRNRTDFFSQSFGNRIIARSQIGQAFTFEDIVPSRTSLHIKRNSITLGTVSLTNQFRFFSFIQTDLRRSKVFAHSSIPTVASWLKEIKFKTNGQKNDIQLVCNTLNSYRLVFENAWLFIKSSYLISEDNGEDSSGMELIGFSHPGLCNETFNIGKFSIIRSWKLFRMDEKDHFPVPNSKNNDLMEIEVPYSPTAVQRTMNSTSIAKELMQVLPDVTYLFERNEIQAAKILSNHAALSQLHDLRLAQFVRKNQKELYSRSFSEFRLYDVLKSSLKDEKVISDAECNDIESLDQLFVFNASCSHVSRFLNRRHELTNPPMEHSGDHAMKVTTRFLFTHLNWLDMLRICMAKRYAALLELDSAVRQWFEGEGRIRNMDKGASSKKFAKMAQLEAQVLLEKADLVEVLERLPTHDMLLQDHAAASNGSRRNKI